MRYPRYAGRSRNSEKDNILKCYICSNSSSQNTTWYEHTLDPHHLIMVQYFNEVFTETKFTVKCKQCNIILSKKHIISHALTHQLYPWYKPDNFFFTLFKHFITEINDIYYCHLCKVQWDFWDMALDHVNNLEHIERLNMKVCEDIGKSLPPYAPKCELMIKHHVFPKNGLIYECMICERRFGEYQDFDEHVNGQSHQLHEQEFLDTIKKKEREIIPKISHKIVYKHPIAAASRKKSVSKKNSAKLNLKSHVNMKSQSIKNPSNGKTSLKSPSSKITPPLPAPSTSYQANETTPSKDVVNNSYTATTSKLTLNSKTRTQKNTVIPMRQFASVIYSSNPLLKRKSLIRCRMCKKKIRGEIPFHVHMTSHFWMRFVRFSDTEGDVSSEVSLIPHKRNESIIENMIEKSYEESSLNTDTSQLPIMSKLINELACMSIDTQNYLIELSEAKNTCKEITKNEKTNHKEDQKEIKNCSMQNSTTTSINQSKSKCMLQFSDDLDKQLDPDHVSEVNQLIINDKQSINHNVEFIDDAKKYMISLLNLPKKNVEDHYLPRILDVPCTSSEVHEIYRIDNRILEIIKVGILLSFTQDENNIYCMICRHTVPNSTQYIHEHLCSIKHMNYFHLMKKDHAKFQSFPNSLSDLQLALQFIEEISDLHVKCRACNEFINNTFNTLNNHIESRIHQSNIIILSKYAGKIFQSIKLRMFRDWYNIERYWCVPCCVQVESEYHFIQHLNSWKHNETCAKYVHHEDLMYDYCATCVTVWFGFQCTFGFHCQCDMHQYHLKDSFYYITKLPQNVREIFVTPEQVCNELLLAIDNNEENEKSAELIVLNDLKEVALEISDSAKLYPFGSRMSGLRNKSSDLDIFIDCGKMYSGCNKSDKRVITYLKSAEKSLKKRPNIWCINRVIIENVRIPIIKIEHRSTGIECDISFTDGLSVEKTKLIKNYIMMYPLCRNLYIFLKKWINECDLGESSGFSSTSVAWLVIYFLQNKNIVPSVSKLIEYKKEPRKICGWEVGVEENFPIANVKYNFIQLLKEFFILYSQFNYREYIICPLMGEPFKKKLFNTMELPVEMTTYLMYCLKRKEVKFRNNTPICIQDPFDLSQNFTKNVKKCSLYRFKTSCSLSVQLLKDHS